MDLKLVAVLLLASVAGVARADTLVLVVGGSDGDNLDSVEALELDLEDIVEELGSGDGSGDSSGDGGSGDDDRAGEDDDDVCPEAPDYPLKVRFAAGTWVDGLAVVCGGEDEAGDPVDDCNAWNPETGAWEEAPPLINARKEHAGSMLLDDTLWVVTGGRTEDGNTNSVEWWLDGVFVDGVSLPTELSGHCQVSISDTELVVVGGDDGSGEYNKAYLWDLDEGAWFDLPDLPVNSSSDGAEYPACGVSGGELVVVHKGQVSIHNLATDLWRSGQPVPIEDYAAYAQDADGDTFYLIGGYSTDAEYLDTVWVFNPETEGFEDTGRRLGQVRRSPTAIVLPEDTIDC